MPLDTLEARLRPRLLEFAPLRARIRFALAEGGALLIDATQLPPLLTRDEDGEADCTIIAADDNMQKLMDGTLNPTLAFTLGKLKIKGSMGLAMKLSGLLED